jgi:hypothetical protein
VLRHRKMNTKMFGTIAVPRRSPDEFVAQAIRGIESHQHEVLTGTC